MPVALISLLPSALFVKKLSMISLAVIAYKDPALAYSPDSGAEQCSLQDIETCLLKDRSRVVSLSQLTQPMCGQYGADERGCLDSDTHFGVLQYQMQLQRHCKSLPSDFADGKEGPGTRAALIRFQSAYGLKIDGVYGPRTAKALAGPVNGKCL